MKNKLIIIKFVLYSIIILFALFLDYYDVRVLKSGYPGFSIFDFFFYQPFSYFFQVTQFFLLILLHFKYAVNLLKKVHFNILFSLIEVVGSSFVFFIISMVSHAHWGGAF